MRFTTAAASTTFVVVALSTGGKNGALSYSPSSFVPKRFTSTFVSRKAAKTMPVVSRSSTNAIMLTASSIATPPLDAPLRNTKQKRSKSGGGISGASRSGGQRALMNMLVETSGGMEELQELMEQADSSHVLAKQVRQRPSFWKMAGYASIPVSAALGFGLVPSRRFAAHAVGAAVTGIAGAVGKSRLDALTEANAKPAIAQALIDVGVIDNADKAAEAVRNVRDAFGLHDEDFDALCTELYTTYLLGMVKYQPAAKMGDLKELEHLKTALHLTNLQMGEAHAAAVSEWYRTTCLYTPEEDLDDPDHPDRMAMDKLLFLTERALRQSGETEEAFTFEMTRVAKAVKLSLPVALDRVADTADPFYQRALANTRAKLDSKQVSADLLRRARKTLGISDETAFDMHISAFNQEVRDLLGLSDSNAVGSSSGSESSDEGEEEVEEVDQSKLKFADGSMERLKQLQEILELGDTDATYEISLEATPLYQTTALAAMRDVLAKTKTPDEAWNIMEDRRKELLLPEESTKTLISSMAVQALGGPLEETNKFAKVNNEAATYDHLLEALEAKETLISILTKSGWDGFDQFDETFCNPWDKQSANGFLLSDERTKMYRIFLTRSVRRSSDKDGKLSDDTFRDIMAVKGLLGITDQQAEAQSRGVFGPELQKVLQMAVTEIAQDYTPELVKNMQKKVDETIENYKFSKDFLREVGVTFYDKAVAQVSNKSPAGVPTEELSEALESLRVMFQLTKEETYPAHMEYFGTVYKKSVLEAMGTTGVIRPEFREPLVDLRNRLGVSEEACAKLFLEAVEEKMVPMVEWIGAEMERTSLTQKQLSERRGKDMGEDLFQTGKGADGVLGLGAEVNIMGDIMNLVDFYRENDIAEEKQTGTKTVEVPATEDGQEATVKEEPVIETVYPVTALGSEAIDEKMAELLFRQFVVSGFQAQGEQGARYEGARDTFAGILGLSPEKKKEILDNIGNLVYDNFVANAMRTKGTMDQQDMMALATVQGKLGLSSEEGEKLLAQSQKKILSEEIEALMDSDSSTTPESIKAFREKCNAMGMNLIEDVGVSKQRLARMFDMEIIPQLKDGTINADSADVLEEVQESLGIEPEECETLFENVLVRLSKSAMDHIQSELLRGREENTVDLIKELVNYAAFTGGDLGLQVEEATGNQVLNIYNAFDFSEEDPDQVQTKKEQLKVAMALA